MGHFLAFFLSFVCHLFVMFLSFGLSFVGHFLVFYVTNYTSCFRTGFACLSKVSWFCFAATYCSEFDMLFHNNQHAFMSRFHPCTRSCRIWLIFCWLQGLSQCFGPRPGVSSSSVKAEVLAHASLDDIPGVQGLSPFHFQKGV